MQILACDLETTGLDPEINQIIECALVLYDTHTKKRESASWIVAHESYTGDAFCLSLNYRIFNELKDIQSSKEMIIPSCYLSEYIDSFMMLNKIKMPITIAGKNVGTFDLPFLKKIKYFNEKWFHHRILDVGSLYFNPLIDNELPSLSECKKRAGLSEKVTHKALDDANDVIDLIEKYYNL
jgi:oligoribonuclease (3'-5' exoribonuclease)